LTTSSAGTSDRSPPILTISELTDRIKQLLESRFPFVWLRGEISNIRQPPSGHLYFTLKDENAQIAAVMFRGQRHQLTFDPENGLSVTGLGRVSVYEPRGSYQIILEYMEPAGIGALQMAFEKLKVRLAAEGYFDPANKLPLPFLPRTLCLITSPGGAVIHDMLKVIDRRYPNVAVDIAPVSVQGPEAAAEIAAALRLVNRMGRADIVVLARGGGSLEDLQAFNSETVAQAIHESGIPIVSAIGHETDYTIADFTADLRAPTPSAAIEMVLPEKQALQHRLTVLTHRLNYNFNIYYEYLNDKLSSLHKRIAHPVKQLQDLWLRVDDLTNRLDRNLRQAALSDRRHLEWWIQRLFATSPLLKVRKYQLNIEELYHNILKSFNIFYKLKTQRFTMANARLAALNPIAVLQRGYSITRTLPPDPTIVTAAENVHVGQRVEVLLAAGRLLCQVEGKSDYGQEDL